MKKFILAALAALSLGVGSAYAAQPTQPSWVQSLHIHPAYSDEATGG